MMSIDRPRNFRIFFLFVIALLGIAPVTSAVELFPLDELQVGMRGYGLTVIEGTEIERFEAEVLGILPDATLSGDLIMIRVSGSVIDRAGGIASGMSGSPVYIDGKLVGAVGYGFAMADHRIALVTPIHDMLPVLERIPVEQRLPVPSEDPKVIALDADLGAELPFTAIAVAPDPTTALRWQEELGPGVGVAVPVPTPLMISGLGRRTMARLGEALAAYNVVPVQAGGAPRGVESAPFEPGSALGVQLARGDVNISSIGTVTYVDGSGFLAFGHPFFQMGDVDFITTTAYIHHTVPSVEFPFKIGAPLEPVGRLLQDRSAAIAGTLSSFAETIPLQINVFDRDTGRRQTFRADIVNSTELTTAIASVVALEAMDRAIDRIGSGTARVIMQISGEELPKRVVRDNLYFSHSDIAATSLTEFLTGLEAIVSNEFKNVKITSIRLDAEVEKERWTARIVEAVPLQQDVYPGETVDVQVRLRPYRGEEELKVIRLQIPFDVQPGEVTVTARSGGFGYFRMPSDYVPTGVLVPEDEDESLDDEWDRPSIYSLEGLLDVFMNREKNNEVVVEFFPYYSVDSAYLDYYDESGYYGQSSYLTPVQASLATRYVIQGSDTFTLRIAAPPTRSVEKPAAEGNEDEEDTEANGQPKDEPAEPMAEEPSQPQGERDLNPPEALNAMVYRARRS